MLHRVAKLPRIGPPTTWFGPTLRHPSFGRIEWAFLIVAIVAAALRLWELNGRTMHYDEAIHLHFAWKLAQGIPFIHSPWMHGPLQIEMVAAIIRWIGDTDFLTRLPYAAFGVVLVALPYWLRRNIGEIGAVCAAIFLTLSPTMLYFSRFGRNDILMAVWALLLLILMWRYAETSRNRYLYWSALVVALMLATKETAYFVIFFVGVAALVLGWRQIALLFRRRQSFSALNGAAGFFVFLAALTLPQAAAIISLLQTPLGLTLAAPDTGSTGETGAPVWAEPFVSLPLWAAPSWLNPTAAVGLIVAALVLALWAWRLRSVIKLALVALAVVGSIAATSAVFMQPLTLAWLGLPPAGNGSLVASASAVGTVAAVVLVAAAVAGRYGSGSWRRTALIVGAPLLIGSAWMATQLPDLAILGNPFPEVAATADLAEGRVALHYLVPVLALLMLLVISLGVGVAWGGGVWLIGAGIFYLVWTTLFTTFFSNATGLFTGSWQSLGYWLVQQGEARGNQPWYYYAIGLSVYEMLALVFGLAAVVWLIRRREPFGLALAAWTVATLAAYTIAGEKMPWLLVNITLPLALSAGALVGHLAQGIPWSNPGRRNIWLLILSPAWIVLAVWIGWLAAGDVGTNIAAWLAAAILLPLAVLIAFLMRRRPHCARVAAVGIAGLLLLFGTVAAFRAAYTYDDSNLEVLVYAQGSADLPTTYRELQPQALAAGNSTGSVKVDYDMWYPFQWYVRNETQAAILQFDRFCTEDSEDETEDCRKVGEDTGPLVYLAEAGHEVTEETPAVYRRDGPMRNLLWYPETYRRPGENRQETNFWAQLSADVGFFRNSAVDPSKWREAITFVVARRQDSDWYNAEYFQYTRNE